jgi:hypothetical protein
MGMGFPTKILNDKGECTVISGFVSCFETYSDANRSTTH